MPKKLKSKLAINGGKPVRSDSAPPRDSIGKNERKMINEVLDYYQSNDSDPSYQGHFEELYTAAFAKYQGGGFADAVSTGTAAVYLAVQALKLPAGSEVLVSPISDPGTYSAIILNGLIPRLVDSAPGSYNAGPDQIKERCTTESKAILLVHAAGQPAKIDKISMLAKNLNLKLIEDCSQAHGAHFNGQKVGTFGDISAFSTMYKKAHNTGGSGGVVYATNE